MLPESDATAKEGTLEHGDRAGIMASISQGLVDPCLGGSSPSAILPSWLLGERDVDCHRIL